MRTIRLTVEVDIEEKDFEDFVSPSLEEKRKEWDDTYRQGLPEQVKELRTNIEVIQ